jgi:GcrA cell cycle regulator
LSVYVWTEEVIERCKELNAQGLSFQAVADQIGNGLTRNMVIGKLRRLGVAAIPRKKPEPSEVEVAAKPRTRDRIVTIKAQVAAVPPSPIPASPPIAGVPVSILDLKKTHCRAVLDQRGTDPHQLAMFCGAPKTVGSSYCAPHTRLFTQPPKESNGQARNVTE